MNYGTFTSFQKMQIDSNEFPLLGITEGALAELSAMQEPRRVEMAAGMWESMCEEIADERLGMDEENGVIVQPVRGVLARGADVEMEAFCGFMDTRRIEQACEAALDPRMRGLVFAFDSPGGIVNGWGTTLAAIANVRAQRPDIPVAAFVEGMACSLAYIFAAAREVIDCAPSAVLGSIGVMAVTTDSSRAFMDMGLERRLFADGTYKGMGTPGVQWKQEWYDAVQAGIDKTSKEIRAHITAFRPGTKTADMQGQVWNVENAPKSLYDGIAAGTLEQYLSGV